MIKFGYLAAGYNLFTKYWQQNIRNRDKNRLF